MGHDIYAHNKKGQEVSYLRYSAFNGNSSSIYEALQAQDCNGGVSGNGAERYFELAQIEKAIENPMDGKAADFLKNCKKCAEKEGGVKIAFC